MGIFVFSDLIHQEYGFYNDINVMRWHVHRTHDAVTLVGITKVSSSAGTAERCSCSGSLHLLPPAACSTHQLSHAERALVTCFNSQTLQTILWVFCLAI